MNGFNGNELEREQVAEAKFKENPHMSDVIEAPGGGLFCGGKKYWFVDTCSVLFPFAPENSEKKFETVVVPCSVSGTVQKKDWEKPTLLIRHSSALDAENVHKEIVGILKTEKPDRVPARMQSLVGEIFIRKSALANLRGKQQSIEASKSTPIRDGHSKNDPQL